MRELTISRPTGIGAAIHTARAPDAAFIAGGSDLMQLMKDRVENPARLVDLEGLPLATISVGAGGITAGALVRMADFASHPVVMRDYPAVSQALLASASPQVRNMGTMGGNLLQRTRCLYFRDTGFPCNKREPGSGCPAIHGENRNLAVLGVSEHCIASHPSDLAVALVALGAFVQLRGPNASRRIPVAELHRTPGDTPHIETVLQPGELIEAIFIPASEAARRSVYVKLRDRASFEFALVSAAVGLAIEGGTIREARVAMGGVGTKPWPMPQVEDALRGHEASDATFRAAAARATDDAHAASQNAFKLKLMPRVLVRAMQSAAA